jgi:hypothetical protein
MQQRNHWTNQAPPIIILVIGALIIVDETMNWGCTATEIQNKTLISRPKLTPEPKAQKRKSGTT